MAHFPAKIGGFGTFNHQKLIYLLSNVFILGPAIPNHLPYSGLLWQGKSSGFGLSPADSAFWVSGL